MTTPPLSYPDRRTAASPELALGLPGGLELVGFSVAALATAYAVPQLGIALDMGRCSPTLAAQDTVLLSHCHSDHTAGLIAWLSAHTRRHPDRPTRVLAPEARRDALVDALQVWPDLDGVRRRVVLEDVVQPAAAGDRIALPSGVEATAFAVHHGAPSLGWSLRVAGCGRPSLVYTGDGTILPFRENPSLLDADAAVVDCTFAASGQRVAARLGGHGHLLDWLDLGPSLSTGLLILSHLSHEVDTEALEHTVRDHHLRVGGPSVVAWIPQPHCC